MVVHAKTGKLYLLLAVLVYLNLFDLLATLAWCRINGFEQELNPFMRMLFASGQLAGIIYKGFMAVLFTAVMCYGARQHFQLVWLGTLFTVYIYGILLCWHILGPVVAGI